LGIEHKITIAGDVPPDDVLHPLLASLPEFTVLESECDFHCFGATTTAVTVSIERDGFLVCDNLIDRQLANEILNSLVLKIKELGIQINDVSEI